MATITIKSTYSFDPETVRLLEDLAHRQGISKSEALRKAIRQAAGRESGTPNKAAEAFDKLRGLVARDREALLYWSKGITAERRASSLKREKGRR